MSARVAQMLRGDQHFLTVFKARSQEDMYTQYCESSQEFKGGELTGPGETYY